MYDTYMKNLTDKPLTRFEAIMARVDAWADDFAGWDCRDEAAYEVNYLLTHPDYCDNSDDWMVAAAIVAWEAAE